MSTVHLAGLTLSAYSVRVSAIQSFNSSYGIYFIRARGSKFKAKQMFLTKTQICHCSLLNQCHMLETLLTQLYLPRLVLFVLAHHATCIIYLKWTYLLKLMW